jgi:hypothetical protein
MPTIAGYSHLSLTVTNLDDNIQLEVFAAG